MGFYKKSIEQMSYKQLIKEGKKQSGSEHPEKAVPYFNRAIELNNGDYEPLMGKGKALRKLNPVEALSFVDQAIAINPAVGAPFLVKAKILIDLDKIDEARVCIEQAYDANPREQHRKDELFILYYELAAKYRDKGEYESAVWAYKEVLHVRPSFVGLLESIANIQVRLGFFDQALVHYYQYVNSLKRDRRGPVEFNSQLIDMTTMKIRNVEKAFIGDKFLELGKYEEAIIAYQDYLNSDKIYWKKAPAENKFIAILNETVRCKIAATEVKANNK